MASAVTSVLLSWAQGNLWAFLSAWCLVASSSTGLAGGWAITCAQQPMLCSSSWAGGAYPKIATGSQWAGRDSEKRSTGWALQWLAAVWVCFPTSSRKLAFQIPHCLFRPYHLQINNSKHLQPPRRLQYRSAYHLACSCSSLCLLGWPPREIRKARSDSQFPLEKYHLHIHLRDVDAFMGCDQRDGMVLQLVLPGCAAPFRARNVASVHPQHHIRVGAQHRNRVLGAQVPSWLPRRGDRSHCFRRSTAHGTDQPRVAVLVFGVLGNVPDPVLGWWCVLRIPLRMKEKTF